MSTSWWTHVYKDGKYVGFFDSLAAAKTWVGRRVGYEITDRRPRKKEVAPPNERAGTLAGIGRATTTTNADDALEKALAAVKAHKEATHDTDQDAAPPAG